MSASARVCRFFSAYRLEHVRKLTIRQFRGLLEQTYVAEAQDQLHRITAARLAQAEKKDVLAAMKPLQARIERFEPSQEEVANDKSLQDDGFEIVKES